MPESVEKIRRSFDAGGWTPGTDLLIDRKQHRTREVAYDNDHERDAIAAALFAFDDRADQFERIADRVPPRLDRDEVIARVVAGESSVDAVLAELLPETEGESTDAETEPPEPSPERRRIAELEDRVARLEGHIDDLQATIASRDDHIEELEGELAETRREERRDVRERRMVTRLERETDRLARERDEAREEAKRLGQKLERLKELWRLDHSNFSDIDADKRGLVPVKPVEKFTMDAIDAADASYGLVAGDVILLRDASGAGRETASRLAAIQPRAVITRGGLSDVAEEVLFEAEIPVGDPEGVRIQEVDELAVAREADVDALVERWEERARRRRRDRKARLVDRLISEHRADRIAED